MHLHTSIFDNRVWCASQKASNFVLFKICIKINCKILILNSKLFFFYQLIFPSARAGWARTKCLRPSCWDQWPKQILPGRYVQSIFAYICLMSIILQYFSNQTDKLYDDGHDDQDRWQGSDYGHSEHHGHGYTGHGTHCTNDSKFC